MDFSFSNDYLISISAPMEQAEQCAIRTIRTTGYTGTGRLETIEDFPLGWPPGHALIAACEQCAPGGMHGGLFTEGKTGEL
jgi:hypothetical protein